MIMDEAARAKWWQSLPAGIRDQVDGYVLQDSFLQAVKVVVDVGFVTHNIGVGAAQLIVGDRYLHYGDRIARTPESPLDVASLAHRAAGCPGRIVAVEAVWDGDTVHDWFVVLLAITTDPAQQHELATVYRSTAEHHLGADAAGVGAQPLEAAAAERAGRALAERLVVPFHFASPRTPDDSAPRWRP
ncbi:hypothetical protein ACFYUY_24580 [Kitasatospora sp. NPDC004745]|uniref:hypothetical protein n=1 Tax=unclassified Kitasatospora TaxID=2633591 RepID=UPI0033D96B05